MKTQKFQIVLRCKTNFNSLITTEIEHTNTIFGLSHCFSILLNSATQKLDIGEDIVEIEFSVNKN